MPDGKQSREVRQRLARALEMPSEIVFDLPRVTMIGNVQMYIENHRGIIEYTPENIRISVSFGEMAVSGEALSIRTINQDEIHLEGLISAVQCRR